jgi:hypothetical protein
MTTSQRLKLAVIAALEANKPDHTISVVDAHSRAEISLPTLAVEITGVSSHSEALQVVELVELTATLRIHSGDEITSETEAWIDQIERVFSDGNAVMAESNALLRVYSWVYGGSVQSWDESVLQVTFSASSYCARWP